MVLGFSFGESAFERGVLVAPVARLNEISEDAMLARGPGMQAEDKKLQISIKNKMS